MAEKPQRPVLLTGASGALGSQLAHALAAQGWVVRLTDLAPFPGAVPFGCSFTQADLEDGPAIARLAEGCGTILHFGGISINQPFETVIGPNIRGLYHIYEAARANQARVVFASSNHSIGFHERTETLDADCQFLPDSFYGLSKAYGESMGRMYWFKHGVENVNVRIGTCKAEPTDARGLSTWLSLGDLNRLCIRATLAETTGSCVIWGVSHNSRGFWRDDARKLLGWEALDSADVYIDALEDAVSGRPIEELFQGGMYCDADYSRPGRPAGPIFGT